MASSDGTTVREVWWGPAARLGRWLLGALTLVGGLTWVLLNLHSPHPVLDIGIGVVLAVGGLVMLMPHRVDLPRRVTSLVVLGFALAGTAAGLLVERAQECRVVGYVVDRGWPFSWVQRGAAANDLATARALAADANWNVDLLALAMDLLLWSYAGLLLVVAVVLVRRARR